MTPKSDPARRFFGVDAKTINDAQVEQVLRETGFGECEGCGCSVERVGWDRLCFACQDEEREFDDERDEGAGSDCS